jgi:GMP synthase (glutamine-hydrolysing)
MGTSGPLLMVQFRTDARGIELEQRAVREKFSSVENFTQEIIFLNAFDAENEIYLLQPATLLTGVQGVILGGSAEFYFGGNLSPENEEQHQSMLQRMRPFVSYLFEQDIPTLGICFGHQLLATFLGETVVNDLEQAEAGSFSVRMTLDGRQDPLFAGVPDDWKAFFMHRDSAFEVPREAILLASGERSRVGAFRYKTRVYGVQFHPELDRQDHEERLRLHPEYISGNMEDFFASLEWVPHARKILWNFLAITDEFAFERVKTLE